MKWNEISDKIRERDKWHCLRCGRSGMSLTVHHIKPRSQGGTNDESNLISLCSKCHDWVEMELQFEPLLKTRRGIINSMPSLSQSARGLHIQTGYPHPLDKRDIWALWIKQGSKGAKELIEKYGYKGGMKADHAAEVIEATLSSD